jgi:carbamate kinase
VGDGEVRADEMGDGYESTAPPTVVVAFGGHGFMQPGQVGTHEEHIRNAHVICEQLMTLVERGCQMVITHGNGPQVGALLERDELRGDWASICNRSFSTAFGVATSDASW